MDETVRRLEKLRRKGYVILPPHSIVSAEEEQKIIKEIANRWEHPNRLWTRIFDLRRGLRTGASRIHRFSRRAVRVVQKALPNEPLELREIIVRAVRKRTPRGAMPHIDGAYIVIVHPFGFQGPWVYEQRKDGQLRIRKTRPHCTAIISGMCREAGTGIAGVVHSSPPMRMQRRFSLIIVLWHRHWDPPITQHIEARARKRTAIIQRLVRSQPH